MLDEAINQVLKNSLEPIFGISLRLKEKFKISHSYFTVVFSSVRFKVNFVRPPLSHNKRFPCVLKRELLYRFFFNSTVVFSSMRRSRKPNFNNFLGAVFELHNFKVFL